jgi:hypothetical protein
MPCWDRYVPKKLGPYVRPKGFTFIIIIASDTSTYPVADDVKWQPVHISLCKYDESVDNQVWL